MNKILFLLFILSSHNSSVIRQKGESQNGCFKKTKQVKFSEKTNISNSKTEEAAHNILGWFVGYISLLSFHDSYLPILMMVGMPEIDILNIGMGDKMLALVCWNLMCFLCFCAGK